MKLLLSCDTEVSVAVCLGRGRGEAEGACSPQAVGRKFTNPAGVSEPLCVASVYLSIQGCWSVRLAEQLSE